MYLFNFNETPINAEVIGIKMAKPSYDFYPKLLEFDERSKKRRISIWSMVTLGQVKRSS